MKRITYLLLLWFTVLSVRAENYPYRSDYLWFTLPDHSDWEYRCGETAEVEISLLQYGQPVTGDIAYDIAPDMLEKTESGTLSLRAGKATLRLKGRKTPGFTDIRLSYTANGTNTQHHLKLGYEVEKIRPWTQEPNDFYPWWQRQVADMRQTPLIYSREPMDELSTENVQVELLKIKIDKQHALYAYLMRPVGAQPGSCPAVLCPPGAGIKTIKNAARDRVYAESGMIQLMIEIHGLDPRMSDDQFKDISNAFNAGNSYFTYGLEDKERYYMRHVYLGVLRALDVLTDQPEWDGTHLLVRGNSQGGALTIVAAALDPRVTAIALAHPALSDMGAYSQTGRTGGYPHYQKMGLMVSPYIETMAYYDVVNFARHITCPVLMTWGYNDNTCPPTTSWAVYNTLTSPKEKRITPINEHWTSEKTEAAILHWLQTQCSDEY